MEASRRSRGKAPRLAPVRPTPGSRWAGWQPAPYAGLGEVWFDDEASALEALASSEWAVVIDDAMRFMDGGSIIVAWSDHRLVRERS
jgi:hypothetical protein